MKVLVSTHKDQGIRPSDFCWIPDDELVLWPTECDADGDEIDGGCGCRRSMIGMDCKKTTTTFTVADVDMTIDAYLWKLIQSERQMGFISETQSGAFFGDLKKTIQRGLGLLKVAEQYSINAILERRGGVIQERKRGKRPGWIPRP